MKRTAQVEGKGDGGGRGGNGKLYPPGRIIPPFSRRRRRLHHERRREAVYRRSRLRYRRHFSAASTCPDRFLINARWR